MVKAKKDGKIKHTGFSFHGSYDTFVEIIDSFHWDATQIQFNYMDNNFQATRKGLDYAAKKGVAVIIMKPLRGGSLTRTGKETEEIIKKALLNAPWLNGRLDTSGISQVYQ
jgi:predicted aldo/keto reductase-like oxidoreductase